MTYILRLIAIIVISWSTFCQAATVFMGDYCTTPPFLSQAIYPNVLLILDNSGSMNEFAYKENNDCRSWNGYTSTVYTGYNSSETYYGYFDPTVSYDYDSVNEYFVESSSGEWSGNFFKLVDHEKDRCGQEGINRREKPIRDKLCAARSST